MASLAIAAVAQRKKPVLRMPNRDYYAGRLLLIPLDSRPAAWQLPRQVARIADHELIVPPRNTLGDAQKPPDVQGIVAWAKKQNYAQLRGAIVSLNLLAFGGGRATDALADALKQRLNLVEWMRAEHPKLSIYGFISPPEAGADLGPLNQVALDLAAKGVFDGMMIQAPSNGDARAELQSAIRSRNLADRVVVETSAAEMPVALVARHLNRTYKRPLKVMPIYPDAPETGQRISSAVDAQLTALGGTRITTSPAEPPNVSARQADVLFFVYPAGLGDTAAQQMVDAITRAVGAGFYVAVADLSEKADERLMKELRRGKMLDLLTAYAADTDAGRAAGMALAQSSARIIGAKFLRNDVDCLQRIERAQTELLFTRYLEDWGYARQVRPKLEAYVRDALKADPMNLGAAAEKAEEFARTELTTLAEGLFAEQFRRNIHSVLHVDAGRVDFMVHSLQRFPFRLPWGRTDVPEIAPRIYVALYSLPPSYLNK